MHRRGETTNEWMMFLKVQNIIIILNSDKHQNKRHNIRHSLARWQSSSFHISGRSAAY